MEDEKVPAGGEEPTETSAGDMSARVTIEVNGHQEETKEEAPAVTDEEEEDD